MAVKVGSLLLMMIRDVGVYWKTLVILLAPIVYLPLLLCFPSSSEAQCGYAMMIMATYWLSEALPLAITAFLPLVLFPFLGIMGGKEVASTYISDTSMVLLGGLVVALAVERCRLHARIALRILLIFGSKSAGVLAGFMLPTWFLSMWISNTATCGMMIPVAEQVIEQMEAIERRRRPESAAAYAQRVNPSCEITAETYFGFSRDTFQSEERPFAILNGSPPPVSDSPDADGHSETDTQSSSRSNSITINYVNSEESTEETKRLKRFSKVLTLSICYSANIGGTATLVGSPTNLLVAAVANQLYEDKGMPPPVTYVSWMAFGIPHALICILLAYGWMIIIYEGLSALRSCRQPKTKSKSKSKSQSHYDAELKAILRKEYEKLGPIRFAEVLVGLMFILLVVLWFARDPGFAPGFESLFKKGYVTDSLPPILVSILLFVLPSELPNWMCCRGFSGRAKSVPALLDWEYVSAKLPWGPLMILGGGYALARAFEVSGLSYFLGDILKEFTSLPSWLVVVIICLIVSLLTEVTSNTAVANLVAPILVGMAESTQLNPLYLMLPAAMACSYAFMLPIATPSNTIVFSYGRLRVIDMASVGIVMNMLCILVVTIGIHTWGWSIFNLSDNPFLVNATLPMTTDSLVTTTPTSVPLA